ncbi:MAG: hypothetical protein OEU92_15145 [Alphaproteobacteria bacterium]|nr:hypothetical protein [Alphaproteobacteria bacterium]
MAQDRTRSGGKSKASDATELATGIPADSGGGRVSNPVEVRLNRTARTNTPDEALWVAIRNRTRAIGFDQYERFIDDVLCADPDDNGPIIESADGSLDPEAFGSPSVAQRRDDLADRRTIYGMDAYRLLKLATEAFLIIECGIAVGNGSKFVEDEEERAESARLERNVTLAQIRTQLGAYLGEDRNTLPYLDIIIRKLPSLIGATPEEGLPYCANILQHRLTCPGLIELIWSYWHEEGMLVQTMNAVALRFQNKRRGNADPLANLELDPLRPLNNLIWGFIQDAPNRLGVQRRAYEYDHHYGISLVGKAVGAFEPADSRTKFIEAFHNLLYRTIMFYREDDDTTMVADAFALLNALREVHIILAEGAHNQFGDLPWQARQEMLVMQWMLSRGEIREFIRGRHMVPYQETWMGTVDDMKRLQGWSDITITHFHEMAVHGEQILLSIRYGNWITANDQEMARNWARYWRPEIQRYIHAYAAATGVDLSVEITDTRVAADRYLQPSTLIARRLPPKTQPRLAAPSGGTLRPPKAASRAAVRQPRNR